jgi:FtsP/CotA-like multicopper oxidase with cupredoxin domain
MKSAATVPQIASMAGVATLMLLAGMIVPGFSVNLSLSARDVGDVIMPPGMIMDFDTPAATMREMGAIHPRLVSYEAPADARGDQLLVPRIENGVKVFDLDASVIRWNILPNVTVDAYAFNRQVPGPRIDLVEGDRVRINLHNELPESTTVHWHGLVLPNAMDGPAEITQPPIPPGGRYIYEFTVGQSGTYFYHTHDHPDRQQAFGLYGALLIAQKDGNDPKADLEYIVQLQEWLKREWLTYPAMVMEGALPNYFTINGKAYPSTDVIHMKVGQTLKLRIIGTNNNFIHPMHMHGGPFEVVARDGQTLSPGARFIADTVNVGPGQRYDVIWTALRPGKWLFHCHIPHHMENNNVETQGGGGLMMIVEVSA